MERLAELGGSIVRGGEGDEGELQGAKKVVRELFQ